MREAYRQATHRAAQALQAPPADRTLARRRIPIELQDSEKRQFLDVNKLLFQPRGAGDTEYRCRVGFQASQGYILRAGGTQAIISVVDACQRRVDALQLDIPPPLRCDGHCLPLHGIHARESADSGLIEDDGPGRSPGRVAAVQQFVPLCFKQRTEVVELLRRHGHYWSIFRMAVKRRF